MMTLGKLLTKLDNSKKTGSRPENYEELMTEFKNLQDRVTKEFETYISWSVEDLHMTEGCLDKIEKSRAALKEAFALATDAFSR